MEAPEPANSSSPPWVSERPTSTEAATRYVLSPIAAHVANEEAAASDDSSPRDSGGT